MVQFKNVPQKPHVLIDKDFGGGLELGCVVPGYCEEMDPSQQRKVPKGVTCKGRAPSLTSLFVPCFLGP